MFERRPHPLGFVLGSDHDNLVMNLQDDARYRADMRKLHHLLPDDQRGKSLYTVMHNERTVIATNYEPLSWSCVEDVKDRPCLSR